MGGVGSSPLPSPYLFLAAALLEISVGSSPPAKRPLRLFSMEYGGGVRNVFFRERGGEGEGGVGRGGGFIFRELIY